MAHYAVGDIQGCYDPLSRLLEQVNFDTSKDTLLCVGDLVNRGPKSLKTLRLLKSLKDQCVSVLGNHDIHLLSMMYGVREPRHHDTLTKVIEAHDAQDIASWLRSQPLLHVDSKRQYIMCHAGIYPWWTLKQAMSHAQDVQAIFQDEEKCVKLLGRIYSNEPSKWSDNLSKVEKHRFTINAFTRMRFCSPAGNLNFQESGFNGKANKGRVPWFEFSNNSTKNYRVIFGHWSALGLLNTRQHLCLDTGYIWGRELTMAKIPKKIAKPVTLYTETNNDV
ncbi:MAG: bis(5'-nucleosyl)-tetraphosphatase (symmetrical) [Arenicella sp.]|jgi:bis(5'-nucleosyl)-tetraphosphatase (symmetrical)